MTVKSVAPMLLWSSGKGRLIIERFTVASPLELPGAVLTP